MSDNQNNKIEFPVDLVYLWVDGSDKEWLAKKELYLKNSGKILGNEAVAECRAKDNDELKISLRCVEKYMPWINKIFIVTDNQIPKWLDTTNPKIQVVFHKDFMPEEILPTFNSASIEMYLHKIPNLSEHFIYANDDMFINQKLTPDFFFTKEGMPVIRLQKSICKKLAEKSVYSYTILKMQELIKQEYGIFYDLEPHHNLDTYTKSICSECENKFEYVTNNKFREKNDTQRSLISLYALATGQAKLKVIPRTDFHLPFGTTLFNKLTGRYGVDSKYLGIEKSDLEKRFYYVNPKLFCFNDNDRAAESDRINAKRFLRKLMPEKSSFEKEVENPLISIIVPVYNVEKYLRQCLESLINQTYKNIEIICINNGSKDKSSEILVEFAQKDSRIKIITQEKSGVSAARNSGLKIASGDYIMFVDSDDWTEIDACEKLITEAKLTGADVVLFSHYDVFPNKKNLYDISKNCKKSYYKFDNIDDYIKNIIYAPGILWDKFCRKDFIENIAFIPDLAQSEDMLFWFEVLYNKPAISVFNQALYNYRNISVSSILNAFENSIKKYGKAHELLKQSNLYKNASKEGRMYLTDRNMNYFCWMWVKHKNKRDIIFDEIQKYLKEYNDFDKNSVKNLTNYKKLEKIIKSYKNRKFNEFVGKIFSIKNDAKREYKIITLLGLEYKQPIAHKGSI